MKSLSTFPPAFQCLTTCSGQNEMFRYIADRRFELRSGYIFPCYEHVVGASEVKGSNSNRPCDVLSHNLGAVSALCSISSGGCYVWLRSPRTEKCLLPKSRRFSTVVLWGRVRPSTNASRAAQPRSPPGRRLHRWLADAFHSALPVQPHFPLMPRARWRGGGAAETMAARGAVAALKQPAVRGDKRETARIYAARPKVPAKQPIKRCENDSQWRS